MPKYIPEYTYTDDELLVILRDAYVKVLTGGQEYQFKGQAFTRVNANVLKQHIDQLESKIAASQRGSPIITQYARLRRD